MNRFLDIFYVNRLIGMMTNPAGASQEHHGGGHLLRQDHGIMPSPAYHPPGGLSYFLDCSLDQIHQWLTHGNCWLVQKLFAADGETTAGRDLLRGPAYLLYGVDSRFIGRVADVETGSNLARYDVARVRQDFQPAYRRD